MIPASAEGWLRLRELRCTGAHGAYPGEQEQPRVFLLDLAVRTDIGVAAASDSLEDAVDFAALAAEARAVVVGAPRALLEAVALEIAVTLLGRFPAAREVRVHLRKPDPPGLDAAEESVDVALSRSA